VPEASPVTSKVLVIATQRTISGARLALALADAGFGVAALTPLGHPVRWSGKIQNHFAYTPFSSIIRAIAKWDPDLLVCTDDLAVAKLQALYYRTAASRDITRHRISKLITTSLGPPTSFFATQRKSHFLALVEEEGLRSPKTIVLPAGSTFETALSGLTYPIVVKADHSYGGLCVRIANGPTDLRAAAWELQTPARWRGVFRRLFGAMFASEALTSLRLRILRTVSLQRYVHGHPGNRAVVCWKGKVLAGISVKVLRVTNNAGPASVVRVIDHPEMAIVAETLVKRLNLSGFLGFDFILDDSDHAWLIEMNPRATPICHFLLSGVEDLPGCLYTQLTGLPPASRLAPIGGDPIALFPNELVRCPSSEFLNGGHHDVPWSEPHLVRRVLNQALRTGLFPRMRGYLERYFPALTRALVRLGLVDAISARNEKEAATSF
jgi:glutathione synthase/RimK-type ligase-like ATP-grasp enzyme